MKAFVFFAILISFQIALAQPYGQWSEPINLGPPINSQYREESPSLDASQDMMVLNTFQPNPYLAGVFASNLINGQWSDLHYVYPLGSQSNIKLALNPDGNEIYFSCYCGGYGDYDIWKVVFDSTLQRWSDPINLGPNINDSIGQSDPFISYDGQRMYYYECCRFAYDGIVVSHRDGDGWSYPEWVSDQFRFAENASLTMDERTIFFEKDVPPRGMLVFFSMKDSLNNWTEPVQFTPINDSGRGFYPRISPDGNSIYYWSQRAGGYGDFDVWRIDKLPQAIGDDPKVPLEQIKIFPNPSNDNFKIVVVDNSKGASLSIIDILGRRIKLMPLNGSMTLSWPSQNNSNSIGSGVYFVRIIDNSGKIIAAQKVTLLK
jgi:hypothetical protein